MRLNITLVILFLIGIPSAMAQETMAELQKLRAVCGPEIKQLCAGVEPGGGRIKACLKKNADNLTVGCAKEILKVKNQMKK